MGATRRYFRCMERAMEERVISSVAMAEFSGFSGRPYRGVRVMGSAVTGTEAE